MALLSSPAFGPKASLMYITAGALMDVWTAVYYFVFIRGGDKPLTGTTSFWLLGIFLTGLTLVLIGCLLGPIGQAARRAELPPSEAMPAEAQIQRTDAAVPHVAAHAVTPGAVMPGVPAGAPGYYPPGAQPAPVPPAAMPAPAVAPRV